MLGLRRAGLAVDAVAPVCAGPDGDTQLGRSNLTSDYMKMWLEGRSTSQGDKMADSWAWKQDGRTMVKRRNMGSPHPGTKMVDIVKETKTANPCQGKKKAIPCQLKMMAEPQSRKDNGQPMLIEDGPPTLREENGGIVIKRTKWLTPQANKMAEPRSRVEDGQPPSREDDS